VSFCHEPLAWELGNHSLCLWLKIKLPNTLPYLTLPYLTLPYLTLPYLTPLMWQTAGLCLVISNLINHEWLNFIGIHNVHWNILCDTIISLINLYNEICTLCHGQTNCFKRVITISMHIFCKTVTTKWQHISNDLPSKMFCENNVELIKISLWTAFNLWWFLKHRTLTVVNR